MSEDSHGGRVQVKLQYTMGEVGKSARKAAKQLKESKEQRSQSIGMALVLACSQFIEKNDEAADILFRYDYLQGTVYTQKQLVNWGGGKSKAFAMVFALNWYI